MSARLQDLLILRGPLFQAMNDQQREANCWFLTTLFLVEIPTFGESCWHMGGLLVRI